PSQRWIEQKVHRLKVKHERLQRVPPVSRVSSLTPTVERRECLMDELLPFLRESLIGAAGLKALLHLGGAGTGQSDCAVLHESENLRNGALTDRRHGEGQFSDLELPQFHPGAIPQQSKQLG